MAHRATIDSKTLGPGRYRLTVTDRDKKKFTYFLAKEEDLWRLRGPDMVVIHSAARMQTVLEFVHDKHG